MGMKFSRTLVLMAALVVVAFVAVGIRIVVWNGHDTASKSVLPAIGGPFALVDQTGRAVADTEYRGRYMLIFFGYTFCPDVCPTTLSTVAGAMDKLNAYQQKKVVPIFITVDPARDTPAVMKDYVAAFGPAIVGLTGSEEQIAQVAKEFKVYAAKVKSDKPGQYTVDHSAILYLMGPDGHFVAHFPHGTSADDLAAGLKKYLG
jgi:protein SCO1